MYYCPVFGVYRGTCVLSVADEEELIEGLCCYLIEVFALSIYWYFFFNIPMKVSKSRLIKGFIR